jgi:ATP-dependent helicase HrpA
VGDFLDSLIGDIRKERGLEIKRTDFRPESLPLHSSMNFRLIDEHGRQLEVERNLVRLRAEYGETARSAFQAIAQESAQVEFGLEPCKTASKTASTKSTEKARSVEQGGYRSWEFGELPETLEIQKGNKTLFGYPALVDREDYCDLEVFDDLLEARKQHQLGLRKPPSVQSLCEVEQKGRHALLGSHTAQEQHHTMISNNFSAHHLVYMVLQSVDFA